DRLVESHPEQVQVDDVALDGVALLVLDDHRLTVTAVELHVEKRVALGQHSTQLVRLHLERAGVATDAVDDAGHVTRTPQAAACTRALIGARLECEGGSLVGPGAILTRSRWHPPP